MPLPADRYQTKGEVLQDVPSGSGLQALAAFRFRSCLVRFMQRWCQYGLTPVIQKSGRGYRRLSNGATPSAVRSLPNSAAQIRPPRHIPTLARYAFESPIPILPTCYRVSRRTLVLANALQRWPILKGTSKNRCFQPKSGSGALRFPFVLIFGANPSFFDAFFAPFHPISHAFAPCRCWRRPKFDPPEGGRRKTWTT